jgi:hypothetical protein
MTSCDHYVFSLNKYDGRNPYLNGLAPHAGNLVRDTHGTEVVPPGTACPEASRRVLGRITYKAPKIIVS